MLDDYQFDELVARDGPCDVWLARTPAGVPVTVRRMPRDAMSSEVIDAVFTAMSSLLQKRRALCECASLLEPHDFLATDDGLYVVERAYFERSLRDHLAEMGAPSGLMEATAARALFDQILDGVVHLHAAGVTHRRLDPAHVLVRQWNDEHFVRVRWFSFDCVVTDRASDGAADRTAAVYASPETALAAVSALTPRSDVFSLAVMLVELLTGHRLPVPGEAFTWAEMSSGGFVRHCLGMLPKPDENVPWAVWPVVHRALAAAPSERFEDARAFRIALNNVWPSANSAFETIARYPERLGGSIAFVSPVPSYAHWLPVPAEQKPAPVDDSDPANRSRLDVVKQWLERHLRRS